ncbi:hypothetical protein AAIR98_000618 [Elusimicrobium simillimum]|uniref:SIMPL domain-containing protein n=1 Tax=Elusimicrobium simillimum TaxID=3143438 RepID=UPI003C6F2B88
MKKYIAVIMMLFVCAGVVCAKEDKQIFSVNADAEVRIKPNRVALTFGVYERVSKLNQGKENMRKTIADAIAFVKKNGVADKYIQMQNINISPIYRSKYSSSVSKNSGDIVEYDFSQTITITLEDLSKYDTILYGLLDLGINKVENINFYSTEMRKYRDEARLLAIKHAQEKAALLTKAAGIKLGKVVNMSENSYGGYYGARMMSNVSQNMTQNYDGGGDNGDLAAGMVNIKAAVTLNYEVD